MPSQLCCSWALCEKPPVDAVEEPGGVIVSYGEDGEPVTIEFLRASATHLIQPGQASITLESETSQ